MSPSERVIDGLNVEDVESFQGKMLEYYGKKGREFPWRTTDNDLHALVAEIMLQQTSYYQVEPQYRRFCERFQEPEDVLEAGDAELKSFFEGLGLESRSEYVKAAAKFLASGEEITQENLLSVKGIGRYTANAFLSVHLERRYPIVDGNVERVFDENFDTTEFSTKDYWDLAWELLPKKQYRDYNLGLLDYGAELYGKNPD
ncbi:MAG: hypothetical protein ABEJ69_00710 [Candidatus Nanohaloarchaea archaeon]